MKRTALNLLMSLICAAAVAAAAAAGQGLMTAKIPFAFGLNNQTLPAGTYTVSRAASPGLLILRNARSSKAVAVIVHDNSKQALNPKAQLDFHRYGDQYFLSAIKQAGSSNCFEPLKSRREREAAATKNLAGTNAKPEIVTITAE